MDPHRLRLLLELSRRGSMRAVAEANGYATSAVSQQLAVLAKEAGAVLLERSGRNVRLTPAGHRLAEHAVAILGAIEAARADLGAGAEPAGLVRVAAFATALRFNLVPIVRELTAERSRIHLQVSEREPDEVVQLIRDDAVDLGLIYDYNLAPRPEDRTVLRIPLWQTPWQVGVPAEDPLAGRTLTGPEFGKLSDRSWITNSRGDADERVVRALASLAGSPVTVAHRADSLSLVQELITSVSGVALLPADMALRPGVAQVRLTAPPVLMNSYAVLRQGRERWAPVAEVLRRVRGRSTGLGVPPGAL